MPKTPGSKSVLKDEDSRLIGLSKRLDQLPLGMFLSSPKGELEYTNRFMSELITADDAPANPRADSVGHQLHEVIRYCALSGKPQLMKSTHPEGADLSIRVFPMTDEAGRVFGVVGLVENLSSAAWSQSKLEKKISELSILCELGEVLRSTLRLEQILGIVLTAVTAGQGLGFNRAFLLLVNDEGTMLEGKMALGPSSPDEAQRIWDSLSTRKQSLQEVLRSYRSAVKEKDVTVNLIVKKLRIPLSHRGNPLIRSMLEKRTFVVARGETHAQDDLLDILQTDTFAAAPLISEGKILGAVVADNLITSKPIEEDDVKLLSIFAHHASTAIEKSRLYQELEEKVSGLAEANRRIAESSQRLLKVERLSILGQITSQLAHELRNPMTIIGGFARSVLRKMETENPDAEYLRIMVKETERMENVLNNVLNFSKPDCTDLESVSLNELVSQTFEMMEPEIDSGKISMDVFPCDTLPPVRANPDLIRQALLNIFRNAVWAMPNGGMLSVTTKAKGESVRIEIKDTGFGICREHVTKVFDAFFTTNSEACGLGLTIASEIIKNHGGDIGVESAEGMGSTFYIELPSTEDAAAEKPTVPQ